MGEGKNEKRMPSLNEIGWQGLIVGIIFWLLITWFCATETSFINQKCSAGDLVLFAIIGVGFLGPSYLVALIIGLLFGKIK